MWRSIGAIAVGTMIGIFVLGHVDGAHSASLSGTNFNAVSTSSSPRTSYIYLPLLASDYASPLWRFGIDGVLKKLSDYGTATAPLRLGWYFDFGTNFGTALPSGMEYVGQIRVKQLKYDANGNPTTCRAGPYYLSPVQYNVSPSLSQIATLAQTYPGRTWIVGNEMERIDEEIRWNDTSYCTGQDEMLPELYATAYHDIYTTIKNADPSAQVAVGGMVQFTLLRQQYMQRVWDAYQVQFGTTMPVDVWNIHIYVFNEANCAQVPSNCWGAGLPAGITTTTGYGSQYQVTDTKYFTNAIPMIVAMRTWMANNGQRDKPLITTEYGSPFPDYVAPGNFTPPQVRDNYMYPSFDYFLYHTDPSIGMPGDGYRLIQRWAWWSLDYDGGAYESDSTTWDPSSNGNLFNSGLNPPQSPTPQGPTVFATYWQEYVRTAPGNLPIQSRTLSFSRPIISTLHAPALSGRAVTLNDCTDNPRIRAEFFFPLSANAPAAERSSWIEILSRVRGGARICAGSTAR